VFKSDGANGPVAIKTCENPELELQILKLPYHPSIVRILGMTRTQDIVMEWFGEDLHTHIYARKNGLYKNPLPLDEVFHYMLQLARAVEHCHAHGLVHRDIKPENILVKDKRLKLCDFDTAVFLESGYTYYTDIGTQAYNAPEMLMDLPSYTSSVDIWSMGCVLDELLTRKVRWQAISVLDQLFKIFKELGTPDRCGKFPREFFPNWPSHPKIWPHPLLASMFRFTGRLTASQIVTFILSKQTRHPSNEFRRDDLELGQGR
jgi:serine/threonine protein kinase